MTVTMFGRPGLPVVYVCPFYIASIAPYPHVSVKLAVGWRWISVVATAFTVGNVTILCAATFGHVASRTLPSVEVRWACGALWFLWRRRRLSACPFMAKWAVGSCCFAWDVSLLKYNDVTDSADCPRRVAVFGSGVRESLLPWHEDIQGVISTVR